MATDANFRDVTAGDDVITAGIPADDVTGEFPVVGETPVVVVVGGGGGTMVLASRRATNCCGSTSVEGNSAPKRPARTGARRSNAMCSSSMYFIASSTTCTFETRLFLAMDGTIALSLRYSDRLMDACRYLRQTFCPASIGGLERPLIRFISRIISIVEFFKFCHVSQ